MTSRARSRRFWWIVLLISVGIGGGVLFFASQPDIETLIDHARQARIARDLVGARRWAEAAVRRDRYSPAAFRILGQIAVDEGKLEEAIDLFAHAANGEGLDAVAAAVEGGRQSLRIGMARRAEGLWRRALQSSPRYAEAASELAYLLGVEGRGWEMQQLLVTVVRGGHPTIHHLVLLAASEPVVKDDTLVRNCLDQVPDDLLIMAGGARTDLFEGRSDAALTILKRIVRSAPDNAEVQARLGWALLELQPDQFSGWLQSLEKTNLPEHPEIWAVKGTWETRERNLEQAARSFAQALRLDPEHRMANYQLGTVLTMLGRSQDAQPFLERASKLQQLALLADRIYAHPRDTYLLRQATDLTAALGRPHEAWGWCWIASQVNPQSDWAGKNADKFRPWLDSTAPRSLPDALPKIPSDLLDASSPNATPNSQEPVAPPNSQVAHAKSPGFGTPRFEDVARSVNIDFKYDAGSQHKADGVDLIEFTGGGVAALDYDQDGRCDLYFTQGRAIPLSKEGPAPMDRLFRQAPDGQASDVTIAAGLGDVDYSQGCTYGDLNQDGFPDLYVCNVGRNRLYQNNGDGTFTDITQEAGVGGSSWTVSAFFADLNGDGFPELFDVNYLDIDPSNIPHCSRGREDSDCAPTARPPAPDQLWLNLGNGCFQDVSRSAGLLAERETGRGLGVVAADLNDDGRIDIFIANDAEPNFLYFRQPTNSANLDGTLEDRAVVSGVAYDHDGLAQACMGVALGDADRNGLLDLYVTNYADQSDTLYLQIEPGLFRDGTRGAGLREPTYSQLGFGTQFIDADLDGWLDLVRTNGHVYDMSYAGKAYAMRPQLFRNTGRAKFVEAFQETAGEFFGRRAVGRGLAKLDWNQDGREDFAISHIGSPAALLLNRTESSGHFVSLALTGTACERDAIGARIRLTTSTGSQSAQVASGDGYAVRNQSQVVFGLGNVMEVDALEIVWPSGSRQSFSNVEVDGHYRVIEGHKQIIRLR